MAETDTLALGAPTLCSLAVHVRRVSGQIVGRPLEIAAVHQELASGRSRLAALTVEGEPGIGKTRLLLAAAEIAASAGFTPVAVTADEEIRGPFLLARSILGSDEAFHAADGTDAYDKLRRAVHAISGRDDPSLEGLSSDRKLLRAFDLTAIAVRALAEVRPLAVLVDDLQWADEDSLRMLRYIVRTSAGSPMFMMFAIRPEETAFVNEAVTLLADMERMGVVRRMRVGRFSQVESTDFLQRVLGGTVDGPGAATMHAQAEGVPYILEEIAHAYRDQALLQQIDGVWRLARNAERLVPSNVRTLINRRSARLPDTTKVALAEAAILGRTFSIRDLLAVKSQLGDADADATSLAEAMTPACAAGLLLEHPPGSPADYSFAHEQIRESSAGALSAPRRRAIHSAIVDLLTASGDPPAASLPMIAHHALAAGMADRAARFSVAAARAALDARAPEEVMRVVDLALPSASAPQDRIELLRLRDDAFEMLRRPGDRLDGLAELTALAEALSDTALETEVTLRRAAAHRESEEFDRAAELSRKVRAIAAERGDAETEMRACLELGQALMHAAIGETFAPAAVEVDLDGAEETYERALRIAEDQKDEASIAAASRELGVISIARVRTWFVERVMAGEHIPWMQRIAAGEAIESIIADQPIAPVVRTAGDFLQRALEAYEGLGDRRGAMSTVIAMAYISWGPDIHMPGSAKRIEEIRRLSTSMTSLTKESERAADEAQMLFGTHVYARAKVFPDLAITRGREAYEAARAIGDRSIEFSAAGGVALAYRDLGDVESAESWLDRAAAVAATSPTRLRGRQLEMWRGMVRATAGDADGLRAHLDRAVDLAASHAKPAARCEALARLAIEAAGLAAERRDTELLEAAERAAHDCKAVVPMMPGRPLWGAQADAALAIIHHARGDAERALGAARSALATLQATMTEDLYLDVVLPASRVVLANGSDDEKEVAGGYLRILLAIIAQRFLDESIRVRWFTGPVGRALTQLAGPIETQAAAAKGEGLPADDVRLLSLLVEGRTNHEIAEELGADETAIGVRLAELYAKIGATSRAEATSFALMGRII